MAKINSVGGLADKVNLPPGALVHVGQAGETRTEVSIYGYGPDGLNVSEGAPEEPWPGEGDRPPVLWIRVRGLNDPAVAARIGERFNLHPLVLEDVLNTHHRPKLEEFEGYLFLISHSFRIDPGDNELTWDQVSLILGPDWVISFEERAGSDALSPMIDRLRTSRSRARSMKADYLFYALLDLVVDSSFTILEALDESMDRLELGVIDRPDDDALNRIYQLRRQALRLRRAAWPMRETANSLLRDSSAKIGDQVQPFLRDLYDHTVPHPGGLGGASGKPVRPDGPLPGPGRQPDEPDHEGPDRGRSGLHPPDLPGRVVRHELQVHAGVGDSLGLPRPPGGHGRHRRRGWSFFSKGKSGFSRVLKNTLISGPGTARQIGRLEKAGNLDGLAIFALANPS